MKNTTVVFPAALMSTIEELVTFVAREDSAAHGGNAPAAPGVRQANGVAGPAVTKRG